MNNKGFTLVELLGTVAILVVISIIAFPPIIENIRKATSDINAVSKELIFSSTDLYLDRLASEYPKIDGNVYCITIDTLVESGDLKESVAESINKGKIDLKKTVKATVKSSLIEYDLVDSSNCEQVNN